MTSPEYFRIVYVSRNLLDPDAAEAAMREILDVSRRNNVQVGVTGALLFSDDCFAQALEGPLDAVEETFERIQCDLRHNDVVVLEAGPATGREFPDWSMAYAGRCTDDRARFDSMVGPAGQARDGAGHGIRALLRGAVERAVPAMG